MHEVLFLMAFTLHNIEEGIWLPDWSKYAKNFHPPVSRNEFHFALLIVTVCGYLLTFIFSIYGEFFPIIKYAYLGFVLMMCFNSIFPHLLATIVLKKYSPGTITGLMLNLPFGSYIIFNKYNSLLDYDKLLIGFAVVSAVTITSLKPLFELGAKLIDEY